MQTVGGDDRVDVRQGRQGGRGGGGGLGQAQGGRVCGGCLGQGDAGHQVELGGRVNITHTDRETGAPFIIHPL